LVLIYLQPQPQPQPLKPALLQILHHLTVLEMGALQELPLQILLIGSLV
jgi:hypothetical protein